MSPRYNLAVQNLTALVNKVQKLIHKDDVKQLKEDLFHIGLFKQVPLQKPQDPERSTTQ